MHTNPINSAEMQASCKLFSRKLPNQTSPKLINADIAYRKKYSMEYCERGCARHRKSNIYRVPEIVKNVQPGSTIQLFSDRRRRSCETPVSAKAAFIDA